MDVGGNVRWLWPAPGEWLDFISTMTTALAWPIAFVIAACLFRHPIAQLLSKVRTLAFGGASAEFVEKLDRSGEQAIAVIQEAAAEPAPPEPVPDVLPNVDPAQAPPVGAEAAAPDPDEVSELQRLKHQLAVAAEKDRWRRDVMYRSRAGSYAGHMFAVPNDPAITIMREWDRIERALVTAAWRHGLDGLPVPARYLLEEGWLHPSAYELIESLRSLRNDVVHKGIVPAVSDAVRYQDQAGVAVLALERAAAAPEPPFSRQEVVRPD